MPQTRNHPDVRCERLGAAEAGKVADLGDYPRCCHRSDAVDGREQLADFMLAQRGFDAPLEIAQALTLEVDVLARVLDLHPISVPVMLPDGGFCRGDQLCGELAADLVPTVVDQLRELPRQCWKCRRSRVLVQNRRRELAIQSLHVSRELGKPEVDRAMKPSHRIPHVLQDTLAKSN